MVTLFIIKNGSNPNTNQEIIKIYSYTAVEMNEVNPHILKKTDSS